MNKVLFGQLKIGDKFNYIHPDQAEKHNALIWTKLSDEVIRHYNCIDNNDECGIVYVDEYVVKVD